MATIRQMIRQVPCPACGAEIGQRCFRGDRRGGKEVSHNERIAVYRDTLASPAKNTSAWRERYDTYIATSAGWKAKRQQRLALDGNTCRGCGASSQLNVHHLHYRNLGNEPMADLITVCEKCHSGIHGLTKSGVTIAKATAIFLARKR